ncbi:MAG: hypothetical protein ACR2PL_27475 [Dehalococcoidia bacterium]
MGATDYEAEYRQLDEAEKLIRASLHDTRLPPGRVGLLDQDLAEIRQIRYWLGAGGTGIRSTLVTTIEALVGRVSTNCTP